MVMANLFYFELLSSKIARVGLTAFCLAGLAACDQPRSGLSVQNSPAASDVSQHGYVDGKGYPLTWPMADDGVISMPEDINLKAKSICIEAGYDRAYAHLLEFDMNEVTGYFRCRGQGGS